MSKKINEAFFRKLLTKMVEHKHIFSAVLCVENGDKSISWTGAEIGRAHV